MSYGVVLFDTFIPALFVAYAIAGVVFGLFVLAIVLDGKEGGK